VLRLGTLTASAPAGAAPEHILSTHESMSKPTQSLQCTPSAGVVISMTQTRPAEHAAASFDLCWAEFEPEPVLRCIRFRQLLRPPATAALGSLG